MFDNTIDLALVPSSGSKSAPVLKVRTFTDWEARRLAEKPAGIEEVYGTRWDRKTWIDTQTGDEWELWPMKGSSNFIRARRLTH